MSNQAVFQLPNQGQNGLTPSENSQIRKSDEAHFIINNKNKKKCSDS
jgi:hypothetical protein